MKRKPRGSTDRLVNWRLLQMTYGQIGFIQGGAGFLAYCIIMAQHGFHFSDLIGTRKRWNGKTYDEFEDHYGQEWVSIKIHINDFGTYHFVSVARCSETTWIYLSNGIFRGHRRHPMVRCVDLQDPSQLDHTTRHEVSANCVVSSIFMYMFHPSNEVLNFAIIFETCVAIFLSYCPQTLSTQVSSADKLSSFQLITFSFILFKDGPGGLSVYHLVLSSWPMTNGDVTWFVPIPTDFSKEKLIGNETTNVSYP